MRNAIEADTKIENNVKHMYLCVARLAVSCGLNVAVRFWWFFLFSLWERDRRKKNRSYKSLNCLLTACKPITNTFSTTHHFINAKINDVTDCEFFFFFVTFHDFAEFFFSSIDWSLILKIWWFNAKREMSLE